MPSTSPLHLLAIAAISAVGGAMNAIAGGGTLVTFPALIGLGIPPLIANATSTVGLIPASMSSMWGYREELKGARQWALAFALPSLGGGLLGAILLVRTPPVTFSRLVPWLVLGATALFVAQGPLTPWLRRRSEPFEGSDASHPPSEHPPSVALLVFQALVSIYGGYFGAGVGILMLAGLGFMGHTNIHRMNGLKNWGGLCMNAVAAVAFAATGLVIWSVALTMAAGSSCGGYVGSRTAQRVGQRVVRLIIVTIGISSGILLLISR